MLSLDSVSYALSTGERIFDKVTFSLNEHQKAALIGSNGVGKSSLFKVITGDVRAEGSVSTSEIPYLVPQLFGQYDHLTLAEAMRVDVKLRALTEILNGGATDQRLSELDDDWSIENRIRESLDYWELNAHDLNDPVGNLSGGEKAKAFLAGLMIHAPGLILLDEPTNHLDVHTRRKLYQYVETSSSTMLITSHDRALLALLNPVIELSRKGISTYGGNYAFYALQKQGEVDALYTDMRNKEAALRKARITARETIERQQKLDARGRRKQEKAGLPTIVQNTLKNNAERSTAKIKAVHGEKLRDIASDLHEIRESLPDLSQMKLNIGPSTIPAGKILFEASGIAFRYHHSLWQSPLNVRIRSGERWRIKGRNGSGKSTLARIILGQLAAQEGIVHRISFSNMSIDQNYSQINSSLTVSAQASEVNIRNLDLHEVNVRLNRFLFPSDTWEKCCDQLSGGERMRLMLCCLCIAEAAPDVIVLDEPTNNLDIQSVEILIAAINEYQGTLIVISHDEYFCEQLRLGHEINL